MARKEANLTAFMLVQQLDPDFYTWSPEEKEAIECKNVCVIVNIIGQRLYDAGMAVAEMHCIIHDKDMREVWDNAVNNYVIENKPEHIHCLVKFWKDDKGKAPLEDNHDDISTLRAVAHGLIWSYSLLYPHNNSVSLWLRHC